MTKQQQVKPATARAVELDDTALDRAAGGGFTGGVRVAVGDVDGDPDKPLIVGSIPGATR